VSFRAFRFIVEDEDCLAAVADDIHTWEASKRYAGRTKVQTHKLRGAIRRKARR
jgi:hypothetical protein